MIEVDEAKILREFQVIVSDLNQSVSTLRRFLRAREYDLHKAESMLRRSVEWHKTRRREVSIRQIDPRIVNGFPHEYPGLDFHNRAVMYNPAGSWPVREMLEAGLKDDMYAYIFMCWENMIGEIEKTGEQCILIIDMKDLNYWKVMHIESVQMCLKVFADFESFFPERVAEFLIINTPMAFNYGWHIVKPLVPPKTMSKVVFLGSDAKVYIPEILKRMPVESLPAKLKMMEQQLFGDDIFSL